jgi:hypothetical protein
LLLASLGLVACGGSLGDAMAAFDQGRYPDAVGDFRRAEADFGDWSEARRARYALYRGLTHLAVGDARQADRWLSYAKRSFDRDPALFTHSERGRLLAAWRSMGRMEGEPARI